MDYTELHAIVEDAVSGNEKAFEQLCAEKMGSILYRVSRLIDNPYDVEDVTQNITLKMYQNIEKLRNPKLFNAWLQSIIMNECKMVLRKRNSSLPILAVEDSSAFEVEKKTEFLPAEYVENKEKQKELLDIIDALPPKRKNILIMYYYEDLSTSEIAQITKLSIGAVTSSLTKAKKTILSELRKRNDSPLSILGGFAASSVLKLVFEAHAQSLFPQTVVDEILIGCTEKIQATGTATAISTASRAATATTIGTARAIGIIASAVVLTGGILVAYYFGNYATDNIYPSFLPSAISSASPPQTDGLVTEGLFTVAGTVRFIDQQGVAVTDTEADITNVLVTLHGPSGIVAGPIAVAADGSFLLVGADLHLLETYTVQMSFQDEQGFGFCTATPAGKYSFIGQNIDYIQNIEMFCTIRRVPAVELVVLGNDCDCGHVNPTSIAVRTIGSEKLRGGSWQIADWQGNILYKGEGIEIADTLAAMLQGKMNGSYTATLICEDEFGNCIILKYDFIIYDGDVEPNQYA